MADAIRDRVEAGVDAIHVVVPATPPIGHGLTWDEEQGRQEAELRLATFLEQLDSLGVTASGEVGDRDPVSAVRDAVRGRQVDEILLSTLPPGISRWLGQDVPSRLRGAVATRVAVVYEEAKAPAGGS